MAHTFVGSAAPGFHWYKPGESAPGALTRTVSAPFVANSISTSSRDLTVQANAGNASKQTIAVVTVRQKNGLVKFKQHGLVVGNSGVEIDLHSFDTRHQRVANEHKVAGNRHRAIASVMEAKGWRVQRLAVS